MAILERSDSGAVAHLVMNAPDRLNALSDAMLAALLAAFDAIAADRKIRAVILAGAGRAFCAGHDLKEMTAGRRAPDGGAAYFADLFARCTRVMTAIRDLPQPVIAQVHGVAAAAGCQLVASCDMAVASGDARFGVNGVDIGLFCSTPMVALSRNIPRKLAFEMLTTGQFLTADRAATLGLINRAVPATELAREAQNLAQTVAAKLASAVAIGKPAFYAQIDRPLDAAYALTGDAMVRNVMDAGTAEGIAAFLEKRPAEWRQDG